MKLHRGLFGRFVTSWWMNSASILGESNVKKLFHFHNPLDFRFAQAGRLGTWYPLGVKVCSECGASRQKRVPPLVLAWEPGSNVIGDFAWLGADDELVVTQSVRDALEGRFREFEFRAIEMWQDPKLKPPQRITKRTSPRIWLPYDGPPLWDVWVTAWCSLDLPRSGITFEKECLTCGRKIYKKKPFEERFLVLDTATWGKEDVFHIYEYPRWIFCTEQVKKFVEEAGYTNVSFLEDGEIPG
jgi:hypothetical protein